MLRLLHFLLAENITVRHAEGTATEKREVFGWIFVVDRSATIPDD